jgi:hypothetical protein
LRLEFVNACGAIATISGRPVLLAFSTPHALVLPGEGTESVLGFLRRISAKFI